VGAADCGCTPWADDCCSCCTAPCGPAGCFWISAEYLHWWTKGDNVPPLVTASPPGSAGILGQPGTVVLFGGDDVFRDSGYPGGRFTAGLWLNCEHTVGIEGSYFFLGSRSVDFTASGSAAGTQTIARPFFNALTGKEDSELVASPGLLSGTVHASLSSELQGAELNGLCNVCCGCNYRLDLLGGFRFLDLDENLGVEEHLAVAPEVALIGGTTFDVTDRFETRNRFYGGQLGARAEVRRGRVFVDLTGKVALGATDESVRVAGSTVITPPGGAATVASAGLLAQATNSGRFDQTHFAVVPELGVNVGYQFGEHVRAFVGYTFLYWSDVARPGNQIDLALNPTQFPVSGATSGLVGPARPAPIVANTDFWAQGVNFGLEFRY
jgi:hypothetical protein